MPSWNDGETSSEEPLFYGEEGDSPRNPHVPLTIDDPEFCGIDQHCRLVCEHHERLMRYVAFEGQNTGRRFLGCARPKAKACSTVHWIDTEWPNHLKKSLSTIWEMYEVENCRRIRESCENAERYYELSREKSTLEETNRKLLVDLSKEMNNRRGEGSNDNQIAVVSEQLLVFHKKLRLKAEKQRDELRGEKERLELHVSELLKERDANREKLMKMKAVLDD